jgi:hypothetical protein
MPDLVPPAVAAVLAQTPVDPEGGLVIVKYALTHCGSSADMEQFAIHGDPEPVAARQAVAVLRERAAWMRDRAAKTIPSPLVNWPEAFTEIAKMVDAEADEIEAQYPTTQQDGRS